MKKSWKKSFFSLRRIQWIQWIIVMIVNDYYQLLLSMDSCQYNNYIVYYGILYYIVIIANWQLLVSLSWWGHGNSHQSQIRIDFFGSSFWNIQARKSRKIRWILCYGVWHLKKTYNHLLTQKFWMDVHFFQDYLGWPVGGVPMLVSHYHSAVPDVG